MYFCIVVDETSPILQAKDPSDQNIVFFQYCLDRKVPYSCQREYVVSCFTIFTMSQTLSVVSLVESNPKHTLFVLEDLSGIRNATERVRTKDRYVSVSWSFYDLEQKLIYKARQNQSSVNVIRHSPIRCARHILFLYSEASADV